MPGLSAALPEGAWLSGSLTGKSDLNQKWYCGPRMFDCWKMKIE